MAILSFCLELFLFYYCYVSVSVSVANTMSVHKTAGSQYFGIMPPKHAKVTHQTLPAPEDEAYQLVSDASYYYHQVNNQVYGLFQQLFGTSDEQDAQINQGVYECKSGNCEKLTLNHQQTAAFHEKLKGKKLKIGNALTAKVQQTDDDLNNSVSPNPSQSENRVDFENYPFSRKVDSSES